LNDSGVGDGRGGVWMDYVVEGLEQSIARGKGEGGRGKRKIPSQHRFRSLTISSLLSKYFTSYIHFVHFFFFVLFCFPI